MTRASEKRALNTEPAEHDTTIEPPASIAIWPAPDQIQWIANKNSYYPFSEATGSDIVEFRTHGTVIDAFLMGGPDSYSHSVSVDLGDCDIDAIRSYVYKAPNYNPHTFGWPVDVNAVKFVSKEEVRKPFADVWEISDEKLIRNEPSRSPISCERVKKGTPVWIEYTIVAYNGKEATKENPKKFDPGVTLRLLSIGMLSGAGGDDSRYNFGSLKKRRVGSKK
jgi:hypothetical protein